MASDRIEELKTVQFPTERRGGYDRRAVDAYLAELADWLATGGEDESRRAVIQRAMGDVGDRTGSILAAAQESADKLTAEAEADAKRIRSDAEKEAAVTRSDADSYAAETRSAADEHARITSETAAAEAKALNEQAEARLKQAEEEAAERTRGIEQEIADLVRKRRDVVANLEQLNAEMRLAIEGPGERDLELPERVEAAVEREPEVLAVEAGDRRRRIRRRGGDGRGHRPADTTMRRRPSRRSSSSRPGRPSPTPMSGPSRTRRSASAGADPSTRSIRRPRTRSSPNCSRAASAGVV